MYFTKLFRKLLLTFAFLALGFYSSNLIYAQKNTSPQKIEPEPDNQQQVFSLQKILERGYIRIGLVKNDQPPFFYRNESGELEGLDIDITKKMAQTLGVEVRYDRSAEAFNDLIPMVVNGEVDLVVSKLSRTIERAKRVNFSNPYVKFKQALLFNQLKLAKFANSTEELITLLKNFDQEIGVIANSSYVTYAKNNFPSAKIIEFPTWSAAVEALLQGEVLVIYRDELEIKKILRRNKKSLLDVKTVLLKDSEDAISIAVNNKSDHLLRWVNLFIEENFSKKITTEYLLNKYDLQ